MCNVYLLTEERPKERVIKKILREYCYRISISISFNDFKILPVIVAGKSTFVFEAMGFVCDKILKVYIEIVSGSSSFVDVLLYHQEKKPCESDVPLIAIEDTKTTDGESRNTAAFQRISKFIFIRRFYPTIQMWMIYDSVDIPTKTPTTSYIFGRRLHKTLGVEIVDMNESTNNIYEPFTSIDELIKSRNEMPDPKSGQAIRIQQLPNEIEISAKLLNQGGLHHDPNIGQITAISQCLRNLGWDKKIIITNHQLPNQRSVGRRSKFILLANVLNISLKGLDIPVAKMKDKYWYYETKGEKIGSIFLHLLINAFTDGCSIFENHAGCEKGYFITSSDECLQFEKYENGDKSCKTSIPDVVS